MADHGENDSKGASGAPGYRRRNNMAASVRSRLTTLAHAQGEETKYLLMRYALERLLYRLGQSPHAENANGVDRSAPGEGDKLTLLLAHLHRLADVSRHGVNLLYTCTMPSAGRQLAPYEHS